MTHSEAFEILMSVNVNRISMEEAKQFLEDDYATLSEIAKTQGEKYQSLLAENERLTSIITPTEDTDEYATETMNQWITRLRQQLAAMVWRHNQQVLINERLGAELADAITDRELAYDEIRNHAEDMRRATAENERLTGEWNSAIEDLKVHAERNERLSKDLAFEKEMHEETAKRTEALAERVRILTAVEEPLTVARIVSRNLGDFLHPKDIQRWLDDHEYDGLWNENGEPHCGCSFREGDDSWLCGDGCPYPDCRPAYKHRDGMMYLEPEES